MADSLYLHGPNADPKVINLWGTGLEPGSSSTGTFTGSLSLVLTNSTGKVLVKGTTTRTLSLSLAAAGKVFIKSTLSKTLVLSLSTTGKVKDAGAFNKTLTLSLASTGKVYAKGTGSFALSLVLTSTGKALVKGILSHALPAMSLSSSIGHVLIHGQASGSLGSLAIGPAGSVKSKATSRLRRRYVIQQ